MHAVAASDGRLRAGYLADPEVAAAALALTLDDPAATHGLRASSEAYLLGTLPIGTSDLEFHGGWRPTGQIGPGS